MRFFLPAGANNLIPMEIALKIANKIRAHERFSAYIVLPMWPEGAPTSTATQRILFWQVDSNYFYPVQFIVVRSNMSFLALCYMPFIPRFRTLCHGSQREQLVYNISV